MIAPIREAEKPAAPPSSPAGEVRRLVASLFLDNPDETTRPAAPVSPWKAWTFLAWALAIVALYFLAMMGAF